MLACISDPTFLPFIDNFYVVTVSIQFFLSTGTYKTKNYEAKSTQSVCLSPPLPLQAEV